MEAFKSVTAKAIPLDRADVDTDQIIPASHLKRVERSGFGEYLFESLRSDPAFVLNDARHAGARILITGPNFGCGSSREHAVWAIEDYGIRAVIAPSFADIFRNNCGNVGVCCVVLAPEDVRNLMTVAEESPDTEITVDLEALEVRCGDDVFGFEVDPTTRERLLKGLDHIGITLEHEDRIAAYEAARD
ncbi:MAG: 3-isopropylmalate dehydratase small subunit [Acidimicrobiia bacterium]|nr:3-isopropylmalate dehydratase small subunit [Acidimicrobiia bacterium]